jgi:hypothetical protein
MRRNVSMKNVNGEFKDVRWEIKWLEW